MTPAERKEAAAQADLDSKIEESKADAPLPPKAAAAAAPAEEGLPPELMGAMAQKYRRHYSHS